VHRDLKPSNLFLTQRSDGTPHVKVLDFGISKSLPKEGMSAYDGTLTATRTVMGSPAYMSPEQVRDTKAVDHRSDVWSLGIILYELVAGGPPFEADTLPAVCAAIAADPPRPLSEHRPEIPPGLEAVVDCCLEKDPARRFQSVRDLAVALKPFACRGDAPLATAEGGGSVPPGATDSMPVTLAAAGVQAARAGGGAPAAALSDAVPSSGGTEPTLVSARPPVTLTAAATTTPSALPRRRAVLLGSTLLAAAALAAAAWLMLSAPKTQAPSATAVPPDAVPTVTFTLLIESLPSGAEVVESDQRLGITPLQIAVDAEAARTRPRTFVLSLPGYEPYSLVQGFSDSNVRALASLRRAPEPPAPVASASASATAPEVAPPAAARWRPTATPRRPDAGSPAATSAPAPDIRLKR
jgi:serine/threonine-protein kinase